MVMALNKLLGLRRYPEISFKIYDNLPRPFLQVLQMLLFFSFRSSDCE